MLKIINRETIARDNTSYNNLYDSITEYAPMFQGYDLRNIYDKRELETRGYEIEGNLSKFSEWKREMKNLVSNQVSDELGDMNYYESYDKIYDWWQKSGWMSPEEDLAQWAIDKISKEREAVWEKLTPLMEFLHSITEEQYLSRKAPNGSKLGKYLKKLGAGKEALDYDGSHERLTDSKRYGLFINGSEYAIWGMSSLAEYDSWDGWEGTSCQDWRHGSDMSLALLGSLNAYKMYVLQLVELQEGESIQEFNSYEAFEDRLIARTNLFYIDDIEINSELVPGFVVNTFYGDNKTKGILRECLQVLDDVIVLDI